MSWSATALAVAFLGLAGVSLAACGGSPSNASDPDGNVAVAVGQATAYRLYTHCGVLSASINNQTFYADPPLSDGSGNPPKGWGNPYDDGTMTLKSATSAEFRDDAGHSAHFTTTPRGPVPSLPVCS